MVGVTRTRGRHWLASLVVLVLVGSACGGGGGATSAAPSSAASSAAPTAAATAAATVKPLRAIKVNGGGAKIADSAIIIAEAEGFFTQAGFKPEYVDFSGPQSVPLLASGALDVSSGQVSAALFNAWNQG